MRRVAIQHERLPNTDRPEEIKTFWRQRLAALARQRLAALERLLERREEGVIDA